MQSAEAAVRTFAGIVLGASISAFLSVEATLATQLLSGGLVTASAYLVLAPSVGWPYFGRDQDRRRALARECRALMAEVTTLAADAATPTLPLTQVLGEHLSAEGQRLAMHLQAGNHVSASRSLLRDYERRFQREAESLFRRATALGCAGDADALLFSQPTNTLGVQEVGRQLGSIADRLDEAALGVGA